MSREFVALLRERPEIAAALRHVEIPGGAPLEVGSQAGATQVFDGSGRMLVIIREPVLVEVPDEAERLLGVAVPSPVWWVEIQAAAGAGDAADVAARLAEAMTGRYGGTVWNGPGR
ncbi:hypothetical protein [Spirillospora sp. NPDC047279]|uniref:hypothetical protein n=1 Tax=Spirillospora sp. NPDC047279 TaxID=3155478 RepID=UPI0033DBEFFB